MGFYLGKVYGVKMINIHRYFSRYELNNVFLLPLYVVPSLSRLQ